jgi:hypothetical protein
MTGSLTITGSLTVSGSNTITNYGSFISNEAGGDFDFRVESDGNANMLFVDGGQNRIGIGTASPAKALHIGDASDTSGNGTIRLQGYSAGGSGNYHEIVSSGDNLEFLRNTTSCLFLKYDGNVGIGTTSPASLLTVAQPYTSTADTTTLQGMRINLTKTGVTTGASNHVQALHVSASSHNAAPSSANYLDSIVGIAVEIGQEIVDASLGIPSAIGLRVDSSGSAHSAYSNAYAYAVGAQFFTQGAAQQRGVVAQCEDSKSAASYELKCESSANYHDFFGISTTTNGATTISTVEQGGGETAHLTFDIDGDVTIDADGGNFTLKDNGSTCLDFVFNGSTDITLDAPGDIILDADGGNIFIEDGGASIGALNNNSNVFEISGSHTSAGVKILSGHTGDITVDAGGNINLDARGSGLCTGCVNFKYDDTQFYSISKSGTDTLLSGSGNQNVKIYSDQDLWFAANYGNDFKFLSKSQTGNPPLQINVATDGDAIFKASSNNEVFRLDGSEDSLLMASGKELQFADTGEHISGDGGSLSIISEAGNVVITAGDQIVTTTGTAASPGAGMSGVVFAEYVEKRNGIITTTLHLDFGEGAVLSAGAGLLIGEDNTDVSYIIQITDAINGVIFAAEAFCIELPAVSSGTVEPNIKFCADAQGVGKRGDNISTMDHDDLFDPEGDWAVSVGADGNIPDGGLTNDYIYLVSVGADTGTYNAGQWIINFYGAAVNT